MKRLQMSKNKNIWNISKLKMFKVVVNRQKQTKILTCNIINYLNYCFVVINIWRIYYPIFTSYTYEWRRKSDTLTRSFLSNLYVAFITGKRHVVFITSHLMLTNHNHTTEHNVVFLWRMSFINIELPKFKMK